jgi:hypothetical protein
MIMKQTLLLTLALFCTCSLSAQRADYRNVQPFEGEVGGGMIVETKRYYLNLACPGFSGHIEGRHNFRNSGFDIAAQLFAGGWNRKDILILDAGPGPFNQRMKPLIFSVLCDYNLRLWPRVSLFVGHGPGLTQIWYNGPFGSNSGWNPYLTFSTRVGAELSHRYRLTLDYKIIGSESNFVGVNLGYVFGGRPKQ